MDKGLSSSLRTNSCCLIHKMSVKNVPEKRATESCRGGPGCAMIDRALAWTPLRNGVFIAARRCRRRGRPGIPATLVAAFAAGVAVWERCGSYGSSVLRCMLGFGARASAVEGPPTDQGSRGSPVRDAGARTDSSLHAGVLIAAFRLAAPACCGAFVDELPSLPAAWADGCHAKRSRFPRGAVFKVIPLVRIKHGFLSKAGAEFRSP
jgi:hypothetical protein